MKQLIDEALAYWEAEDINSHPGEIPEDMLTGKVQDDWKYWRAIESRVTDEEIKDLEEHLGVKFPPSYIELLKHKHFIDLQIGEVSLFSHPSFGWRATITDGVLRGYPKELLLDKGYLPFAGYSDWGLWCFGLKEKKEDGEYPIYLWDHERANDFEKVAEDLPSGLKEQWENREIYDDED